jgi:hypothetical protein
VTLRAAFDGIARARENGSLRGEERRAFSLAQAAHFSRV